MKKTQRIIELVLVSVLIVACGESAPIQVNTVIPTSMPSFLPSTPSPVPSATSLPTNMYTATPEPDTAQDCRISDGTGHLYLLSDQEFRDLRMAPGELDQVLTVHYPEWANYTQIVRQDLQPLPLAKIIMFASHDEVLGIQINPAVTLVTLGDTLDWQLPSDTDLYLRAQEISTELNRLSLDWENPFDDSLRNQYPEVANSGTYALYAFFNYDLDRLQSWCNTYQPLFANLNH